MVSFRDLIYTGHLDAATKTKALFSNNRVSGCPVSTVNHAPSTTCPYSWCCEAKKLYAASAKAAVVRTERPVALLL